MNIAVREAPTAQRLKVVGLRHSPRVSHAHRSCIPSCRLAGARTWPRSARIFDTACIGQLPYPRMMAAGMRMDAFPEDGPPGSDLELMRRQHLDANGVEFGMLIALSRGGMEERNLDSPRPL